MKVMGYRLIFLLLSFKKTQGFDTYKIDLGYTGHYRRRCRRWLNTTGYRKIHVGIWCMGGRAKRFEEDSYWPRCAYIGQYGE